MIQTVLSMILTEWLWYVIRFLSGLILNHGIRVHASIFNDECSPRVEYVFFVVKANALGAGRVISLILTSVLTAGYAAVTFHELHAYYRSYQRRKLPKHHRNGPSSSAEKNSNISSPTSTLGLTNTFPLRPISGVESNRSLSLAASISNHVIEPPTQLPTATHPKAKNSGSKARPRKRQWSGNWDPMLVGIAVFQFIVFAYFVVSTELLLHWNPYQNDGNKWGFGQV
jgi:hypothetical protein